MPPGPPGSVSAPPPPKRGALRGLLCNPLPKLLFVISEEIPACVLWDARPYGVNSASARPVSPSGGWGQRGSGEALRVLHLRLRCGPKGPVGPLPIGDGLVASWPSPCFSPPADVRCRMDSAPVGCCCLRAVGPNGVLGARGGFSPPRSPRSQVPRAGPEDRTGPRRGRSHGNCAARGGGPPRATCRRDAPPTRSSLAAILWPRPHLAVPPTGRDPAGGTPRSRSQWEWREGRDRRAADQWEHGGVRPSPGRTNRRAGGVSR